MFGQTPHQAVLLGLTRFSLVVALVLVAQPALAQRTDEVVLLNGNIVTGEIKELVQGKLRYKTDHIDTLYFEWEYVASVSSNNFFDVETIDGTHFYGILAPGQEESCLSIIDGASIVVLDMASVVTIEPIKKTFWGRIDGSLNLGFSYKSADTILQYSLESDAAYRTRQYKAGIKLSSIQTTQEDKDNITRQSVEFDYTRYRKNRYFGAGQIIFSSNSELGIDFRTQLGYSYGRNFIQTNKTNLYGALGLAVSREKPYGEEPNDHYLSALISGAYHFFLYNYPKTDISVGLVLMPGITDWPRVRYELNAGFKREVIRDFTVNFSAYDSYDSDPPSTESTTPNHDFGVILSVGWTF